MNLKRVVAVTTVSVTALLGGYLALNAAKPYMVSYAAEKLAEPAHFRGSGHGGWYGRSWVKNSAKKAWSCRPDRLM